MIVFVQHISIPFPMFAPWPPRLFSSNSTSAGRSSRYASLMIFFASSRKSVIVHIVHASELSMANETSAFPHVAKALALVSKVSSRSSSSRGSVKVLSAMVISLIDRFG